MGEGLMQGESSEYHHGYAHGVADARADLARLLWRALGESPHKNSDLVEVALRVRALRERSDRDGAAEQPPHL